MAMHTKFQALIPRGIDNPNKIVLTDNPTNLDTWMGHAIYPFSDRLLTPIDTLYYMFWANAFSEYNDSVHHAVIVTKPLRYDNISDERIANLEEQKENVLERIIEVFGLGRIRVLTWDYFPQEPEFNEIKDSVLELIDSNQEYKDELISRCVPDKYRNHPKSHMYVVDEIAAIMYMHAIDLGLRIGHLKEQRLDKMVAKALREQSMPYLADADLNGCFPHAFYLNGGYNLNSEDNSNVRTPTKEKDSRTRLMLTDSLDEIAKKMDSCTKHYRGWIKSILQMNGSDPTGVSKDYLPNLIYDKLIAPLSLR
ncbi:MAG: hypothetical protein NDI94_05020 [Candidatus Woesearchaeota archaeon]|nr:hypothetical protein [Candidatus Woesearchaeota archaeon]